MDENIVRIPVAARSTSSAEVKLTKRTPGETRAYFEGFASGLRAAKEGIETSLANYEKTMERWTKTGVVPNLPEN